MKIEDIARKAGVSKTAVSFALNNKDGISDETRRRILDIAYESGYVSKTLVKYDILTDRSRLILLLNCSCTAITSTDSGKMPFFSELISEIERKVNEKGYHLLFRTIKVDQGYKDEIVQMLESNPIAGVLLVATDLSHEHVSFLYGLNKHVVAIDSHFPNLEVDTVVTDNYYGGFLAGQYLARLGHTAIGYLQSTIRIYNFEERKRGFMAGLEQNGCKLAEERILYASDTIAGSEAMLREQFRQQDKLPTAVFAENDYIAIGAVKCLQSLGIPVPEQVSVVGFDNIETTRVITPELTTIDVPIWKFASLAVERLIEKINHDDGVVQKTFISTKLLERQSCKEKEVR